MKILQNTVCTACGCLCDDIELTVDAGRIVTAKRACVLGKPWFQARRDDTGPVCLVDGAAAPLEKGLARAAELLWGANYPLAFGLVDQTCEAQRAATAIADWMGGCLDATGGSAIGAAEAVAMQTVGKISATLGEVANRSDLVVFWRTDPAATHPRHFARYSLLRKGMFTPGGRKDRTCIVVDTHETKTARAADRFIQIAVQHEFEILSVLRAILRGVEVDEASSLTATGAPLNQWRALADRMKQAKYGSIFYEPAECAAQAVSFSEETARLTALFSLVRDLNDHTRFVALANLGRGNSRGTENVLAWRTGYPGPIDFSQGYPRYSPEEYSAESVLSRREADAALVVGDRATGVLSAAALRHLESIPRVVLAEADSDKTRTAAVAFHIATDGIHSGGTMFRMDGVPLPIRPALTTTRPSAQAVLEQIESRLRQLHGAALFPTPR